MIPWDPTHRPCVAAALVLLVGLTPVVLAAPVTADPDRFEVREAVRGRPVSWVATNGEWTAYGHGTELDVVGAGRAPRTLSLDVAIEDAVVAGDVLYVLDSTGDLRRIELESEGTGSTRVAVETDPGPVAGLALLDDFLVLATEGGDLVIVALPLAHGHHDGTSHDAASLAVVARLPLSGRAGSLTAASRVVTLANSDRELLRIDARDETRPLLVDTIRLGFDVVDLAANGGRIYALAADGLRVIDRPDPGGDPRISGVHPGLEGDAVAVAGRTVWIGSEETGLRTTTDRSTTAAIHDVTVASNFFSPANLTVASGDTVRWTNTGGVHNTESCDGIDDSPNCTGIAVEGWNSGAPSLDAWEFEKTFTLVGTNPYFCFQHRFFGMDGTIVVEAAASTPPGVGDGRAGNGSAMTVAKNDASGASLAIAWDDALCTDAGDHQIVYGGGSTLPSTAGGTYTPLGAECSIGNASPFTWNPSPDPSLDPSGLIWWVVVANDGAAVEGSWGKDGAFGERNGPGTGGSSGECGNTGKDLTNTCGQP